MTADPTPPLDMAGNIVLFGVVGSQLYGLAHEGSDYDWQGVYMAPCEDFFGLTRPQDSIRQGPDAVVHEIGRFCQLLLKGNPTVLEMLWHPRYEVLTQPGETLVEERDAFLSHLRVRRAYRGYGHSQLKGMLRRDITPERRAKWVRHTFRVLEQGIELLTTGALDPVVKDRERLFAYADLDDDAIETAALDLMSQIDSVLSDLPAQPDEDHVHNLLVDLRIDSWGRLDPTLRLDAQDPRQ